MYLAKDVFKKKNDISPGAPRPKSPNAMWIRTDEIEKMPVRDGAKVKMEGNFILKEGARPIMLYMTPSTQNPTFEGDGDEDKIGVNHKFEGVHPGDSLEINEFVQNQMGQNGILIYGNCEDNSKRVYGTMCAPLQLTPSFADDNDGIGHTLSFEQKAKTKLLPGYYFGDFPDMALHQVGDAESITINEENGHYYQLPATDAETSIAVDSVNDFETGAYITLIGGGGSEPAELATGGTDPTIILKEGQSWVALQGATIDFEVYKDDTTTYLIERRRS